MSRRCILPIATFSVLLSLQVSVVAAGPMHVIFDTDMDSDNDDVAALAILHALADLGEVEILAVAAASSTEFAAPCIDAINTYYGRGNIPVGAYKGGDLGKNSRYNAEVAKKCPNDLKHARNAPDAVDLYRRVLASQSDRGVTIIAVGPMNNLVDLLKSKPDKHSSLDGRALTAKKVNVLYVMAPYFNEERTWYKAWNFRAAPAAGKYLVDHWPTAVKFGEGILGHRHFIGASLAKTPPENPARIAFESYFGGRCKDRHCADPTTVLYAVRGIRHFGETGPGYCDVRPSDGSTRWIDKPNGNHYYNTQKLSVADLEQIMNELLVRPPAKNSPKSF